MFRSPTAALVSGIFLGSVVGVLGASAWWLKFQVQPRQQRLVDIREEAQSMAQRARESSAEFKGRAAASVDPVSATYWIGAAETMRVFATSHENIAALADPNPTDAPGR